MREIVHLQAGQCGNQIGAKVSTSLSFFLTLQVCVLSSRLPAIFFFPLLHAVLGGYL